MSWQDARNQTNRQNLEIRRAAMCRGIPGNYVRENQLLGFLEEIGHEARDIMVYC